MFKSNFMKKIVSFVLLVLMIVSCKQEKEAEYLSAAKDFQYKMNIEFADKQSSPLTDEDFTKFSRLHFFPIQEKYRVKANFKRTPNEEPFDMLTTTSRLAKYVKYGIANFTLDGKELSLNVYQNVDGEKHLFLPYFDKTSGKESYSGGKYIELENPKDGFIIIDFNQAYNPYCAYNEKYSCPIPPDENRLDVEIKAGVIKYH